MAFAILTPSERNMRHIFVVLFVCIGIFMPGLACANCAADEFAYTDPNTNNTECITSKFQVTTTELSANTTFSFYLGASGTFYIDWGDGTVDKIERADTVKTLYSHRYTTADTYEIQMGGLATGYGTGTYDITIQFSSCAHIGGGTQCPSGYTTEATGLLVGGISGSLGDIFPTINDTVYKFIWANTTAFVSWNNNYTT